MLDAQEFMEKFVIEGGYKLNGELSISGAKNSALPILTASLLSNEVVYLRQTPQLKDIQVMLSLLKSFGVKIGYGSEYGAELNIDASCIDSTVADYSLVRTMRASILVLGPLLAKYGKARVSLPGGCAIGSRPVDLHLKALAQMGAKIELVDGYILAEATKLKAAEINFANVTVTGTENIMMAAVLAEGTTVLKNSAKEPEVVDLAEFLNSMGAKIEGHGTDTISIHGVKKLRGARYSILPDRIEAGTYLVAAAITNGEITLRNTKPDTMQEILQHLTKAGANIEISGNSINLSMLQRPKAVDISTAPYPGFPTDMQAQFMALNCIADGVSIIKENVFENRFMHVAELSRMGAEIKVNGREAVCYGKAGLLGAEVMATDLRASASLVLAALAARGRSVVNRIYHIDRGYDNIDAKLVSLGAKIVRVYSEEKVV